MRKRLILFEVQEDREQVVRDHLLDDGGHARQKLIEIQRFGGDARNLEQKIEQLGTLAES